MVGQLKDILIVDDEPAIAALLADMLRDEGYLVRTCHDGATALLEIFRQPPSLVVLDVAMPVMLGSDLLEYLRKRGFADLPVIMMTAGVNPKQYLAQGANAVVSKPFDLDQMLLTVQQQLARPSAAG